MRAGDSPAEADRAAAELAHAFASWLNPWMPLPTVAAPDHVAAAALWLASDASALVTGQDLPVDGGLTAGPSASVLAAARSEVTNAVATIAARGRETSSS